MKIHVLADNRTRKRGMLAEHGLSLLIEANGRRVLFDAGQSDVFLKNASAMGLSTASADFGILSHGHYDHGGGFEYLPPEAAGLQVYVQETAFAVKKGADAGKQHVRDVGLPYREQPSDCHCVRWECRAGRTEPQPGWTLLPHIPHVHLFEHHPVGLFVEKGGELVPDPMHDEQVLVLEMPSGLAVFLGCSHPGVINCLTHVRNTFPGQPLRLVMGGMHLEQAGSRRLHETIRRLQDMEVQTVAPLHCTGINAICAMSRRLGPVCRVVCAGDTLVLAD